jgi:hypothetical protein
MAWMHPHSAVKKKFSTVWSPGKVMATVFWDVYGAVSWFHTFQFNNKCSCLSGNSKEAIHKKRPVLLTTFLLLLHDNARPHRAAGTMSLLNPWGRETLPHLPYSTDMAPADFICSLRWKAFQRSAIPSQWMGSKLSQEIVACPGPTFCIWRTWQIDISLW